MAVSTGEFQPLADDDPREVGLYRLVARIGSGGMGRVYGSGRRWRRRAGCTARSPPNTAATRRRRVAGE
jgi:hypothetical protein